MVASLLETVREFLKNNLQGNPAAGDPLPPGRLGSIPALLGDLSRIDIGTDGNGLVDWLDALDRVLGDVSLRDTVVVRALQLRAPRLAEALTVAGLIEFEFAAGDPRAFAFHIAWDKLDAFLSAPGDSALATLLGKIQKIEDLKAAQVLIGLFLFAPRELLRLEYAEQGFAALPDPEPAGAIDLLDLISDVLNSPLRLPLALDVPVDIETFRISADGGLANDYLAVQGPEALGAHRLDGLGVELKLSEAQSLAAKSLDLGGGLRLSAATVDTGLQTYRLMMKNGSFDVSQTSSGDFEVVIAAGAVGSTTMAGPPSGLHLEFGPARFSLHFQKSTAATPRPLFTLRARVERVAFVVPTGPMAILASAASLPPEIRLQTDVDFAYLQGVGLQADGGGPGLPPLATEFSVPLNLQAGSGGTSVTLEGMRVRLEGKLQDGKLRARVIARFGAHAEFGPVRAFAQGMGAWFGQWDGARFGLENLSGLGVALDAGPVSGGGFLAALQGGEFAGGLGLKVIGIGVGAYALFGEADAAPAFVGILGIRLPLPGVQIGFGFAVTGVGGLVGINRRADTDVLREQLASGTSGQILFCDDPTRNGVAVIGQLPRLFPPARGVFLIGPTFQISWLSLLRLDAGVFIELPGPRQIFVAGSARLVIGAEEFALVYLRMDFVGGIDLTQRLIYFDAALIHSHVMQVFTITGGIAFRLAYGDNGYFLFSVGGFHPSFNPGALELPRLARAGTGASIAIAWFKLETYFALTTGTFQVGSAVEAGIELGPISAHGWFRFDAIVQFDPFYFTAVLDAGFDVEVFGESFCGVRVTGTLSGPGPLVLQARASVKLLFVRVSKSVTIRLGGDSPKALQAAPDVLQLLRDELKKPANIRCEGEDASVVLRPTAPAAIGSTPVLGVAGMLICEQKRAPFGLDLQRFEGAPLDRIRHVAIRPESSAWPIEQDWFGVGTYLALSESEALNNARFTQAQSGIRVPFSDMTDGAGLNCPIVLNVVKLPKRIFFDGLLLHISALGYMTFALSTSQSERTGSAAVSAGEPKISVVSEAWTHSEATGAVVATQLSSVQAFSAARSSRGFASPATTSAVSLAEVF